MRYAGSRTTTSSWDVRYRRDREARSSRVGVTVRTGASRKEFAVSNGHPRLAEFHAGSRKILSAKAIEAHRICGVSVTIRQYDPHDFTAIFKLDQSCFPPGIAYSKTMLKYYLAQPGAEC